VEGEVSSTARTKWSSPFYVQWVLRMTDAKKERKEKENWALHLRTTCRFFFPFLCCSELAGVEGGKHVALYTSFTRREAKKSCHAISQ
jgi:hypothetical protein